jgi:hypothetical protein
LAVPIAVSARPCRIWVTCVILSALQRRPLFTQVQTFRCGAPNDVQGQQQKSSWPRKFDRQCQERTHALQQIATLFAHSSAAEGIRQAAHEKYSTSSFGFHPNIGRVSKRFAISKSAIRRRTAATHIFP